MRRPALLALCLAVLAPALWSEARAQTRSPIDSDTRWTLAAVGDVIMNRRTAPFDHPGDPGFHELANIIRTTDAAFLNLEQSVFRLQEFTGWPAAENGGNYEVGSPETLKDLVDMGFNLYNRANNHSTDYGVEGMRLTNRLMDSVGSHPLGNGREPGLGQPSRVPGDGEGADRAHRDGVHPHADVARRPDRADRAGKAGAEPAAAEYPLRGLAGDDGRAAGRGPEAGRERVG